MSATDLASSAPTSARVRKGALVALAVILTAFVTFLPTQRAQAFAPVALVPPAIAGLTSVGGAGGVAATGAVAGGAVVCTGTVVCAAAVVGFVALTAAGTYVAWELTNDNEPNMDLANLPTPPGGAPGFTWLSYPKFNSVGPSGTSGFQYAFSVDPATGYTQGTTFNVTYWAHEVGNPSNTRQGTFTSPGISADRTVVQPSQSFSHSTQWELDGVAVWRTGPNYLLFYGDTPVQNTYQEYPVDPLRKLTSEGTCTKADLTTVPATVATTPTFTQTGDLPPIPMPTCSPESSLTAVVVFQWIQTTTGVWFKIPSPYITVTIPQEVVEDYPDCLTGGAQCITETVPNPDTGTQECKWGPYTTPGACQPISSPNPPPSPNPQPYPDDLFPSVPTDPALDPVAPGSPDPTQTDVSSCVPSGWDILNPLAYVRGTGCVLQWAFIPRDLATSANALGSAFTATALGTIWLLVADFFGPLTAFDVDKSSVPCQGPLITLPISLPGFMDEELGFYPFAACEAPSSTMSELVLTTTTIIVMVGGIWVAASIILSAFGLRLKFFDGDDD